jgi:hypothetical protein
VQYPQARIGLQPALDDLGAVMITLSQITATTGAVG